MESEADVLFRCSEAVDAMEAAETAVTAVVSLQVVVGIEVGSWLVLLVVTGHVVSLQQLVRDDHGPPVLLNVGNGGEVEEVPDTPPGNPVPRLADVKLTPPVPIGVEVGVGVVVELIGESGQVVPAWQVGVTPADGNEEASLRLPDVPVAARALLEFVTGNGGRLGVGVVVPVPLAVPRLEDNGSLPDGVGVVVEFDMGKGADDVGAVVSPAEVLRPELVGVGVPVAPMAALLEFVIGNGGVEVVRPTLGVTVPLGIVATAVVEFDKENGGVDVPVENVIPEPTVCPDGTPVLSVPKVGDHEGVVAVEMGAPVEGRVEVKVEFESGKGIDDDGEKLPGPVPDNTVVPDEAAVENVVLGDEEEGASEAGRAELETSVPGADVCVVFACCGTDDGKPDDVIEPWELETPVESPVPPVCDASERVEFHIV